MNMKSAMLDYCHEYCNTFSQEHYDHCTDLLRILSISKTITDDVINEAMGCGCPNNFGLPDNVNIAECKLENCYQCWKNVLTSQKEVTTCESIK